MIEPNENGPVESEKANEECRGSGRQKRPGKKKWKKVGKMEEEIFSHSSLSLLLRSLHSLSLLNVSPTFSPPYFLSLYNSLVASSAFKREREREGSNLGFFRLECTRPWFEKRKISASCVGPDRIFYVHSW